MFVEKEEAHIVHDANREPAAQLVERRFVMREVVNSTPAGPTLMVLTLSGPRGSPLTSKVVWR